MEIAIVNDVKIKEGNSVRLHRFAKVEQLTVHIEMSRRLLQECNAISSNVSTYRLRISRMVIETMLTTVHRRKRLKFSQW